MRTINITKREAQVLTFWASVGYSKSLGGSYQDVPDVVARVTRRAGIQYRKKYFQDGSKKVFWFTPKTASLIWQKLVGRNVKVPRAALTEFYRAYKSLQTKEE